MALDNGNNTITVLVDPTKQTSTNELLTEEERKTLYMIQNFNGSPGLRQWGYHDTAPNETLEENTKCNTLEGALDGGIFPPHIQKNSSFRMYRPAFCRPVEFIYEDEIRTKRGYSGYNFRIAHDFLATPEENPDNACYCHKGVCPKKGLAWLTPCYYSIPITISQPHFYNADPSLIEQIDGIKPEKEIHDSIVTVFPELGVPLEAHLRVQINLAMPRTKFNSKTKPFNDLTIPLFWLELAVDDIPLIVNVCLTLFYYVLPVFFTVLIWLCGIFGLSMIAISALFTFFMPQSGTPFEDPYGSIDYSPIRIIKMPQYFQPEIRISK